MKQLIIASIVITLIHTTTFAAFKDILESSVNINRLLMTPILTEIQEFSSTDGDADDLFGYSVAIDGDTIIVGAQGDDHLGTLSGSAYVFIKSGSTWTQQAKLTLASTTTNHEFGHAVAISGDTALVASKNRHTAHAFVRSGTTWTFQEHLRGSTQGTSAFLESVAIDGDTAAVGVTHGGSTTTGRAYVHTRSAGVWTEVTPHIEGLDSTSDDRFGSAVALDGNTLVVGARRNDATFTDSGSAYIFTESGGVWTQQAKLVASDPEANAFFGDDVAIDGDTVAISAHLKDDTGTDSGAVYIYTRTGTTWTQQTKLNASDEASGNEFGVSLGLDGDTLVVGARLGDGSVTDSGAAYIFTRSGTTWTETRRLWASTAGASDEFGAAVAIDGTTVVTGAPERTVALAPPFSLTDRKSKRKVNLAGANQGTGYIFNLLGPTAAGVNISGRVLSSNGRAIPRAMVHMTDQIGNIKTARTNMFGYYLLEDIEVGQTLVLNVYDKRYQFETQVVNLNTSLTGFDFIAK